MKKKIYLTIKKFAEACNVSIRTLKYYEEVGLIQPSMVKENGYRLYDMLQIDQMSTILLLKDHGFSLKQIKEMLSQQDIASQYETIKLQKQLILQKKEQLLQKEQLIDYTLSQLENYFEKGDMPFIAELEERKISVDYFDFTKSSLFITNYLLDGIRSGVIIDPVENKGIGFYQSKADSAEIIKGKCLCLYYNKPTIWQDAIQIIKDYAAIHGISLSPVYIETILETSDSNICFTKFFMMIP